MAHAIEKNDALFIGFTATRGLAWHNHENCRHIDENVPVEFANELFDYPVELAPISVKIGDKFVESPNQCMVVDVQHETILSEVSCKADSYCIVQPREWFEMTVGGLLSAEMGEENSMQIESAGTLFNRAEQFVNLNLMSHTVKGDISPTETRLLVTNSFRGKPYAACIHQTRVVCNNTVRAASAQGAVNGTMKKFRHTKNSANRLAEYVFDLAEMLDAIKSHNECLDYLAEKKLTPAMVDKFLIDFVGLNNKQKSDEKASRGETRALNLSLAIRSAYENEHGKTDDLAALPHTAYRMLNAVTWHFDHNTENKTRDDMQSWFGGLQGTNDKHKQKAMDLLKAI